MYKKNKMSENDLEIQNNYPPIEKLQLDNPQVPPSLPSSDSPPQPPSLPSSDSPPLPSSDSCECDDTPITKPDCEPTCIPITLEISPVISVLVNKPKVCLKNKAVCTPKFFLNQ
jgi:hypothetical protein